jgi:hypothetical protein
VEEKRTAYKVLAAKPEEIKKKTGERDPDVRIIFK